MGKNNRFGKAEVLNDKELDRIFNQLMSRQHKLFFSIARYTGERFGAIRQLELPHVYYYDRKPLQYITFPAYLRKSLPTGQRETRQAFIVPRLSELLTAYCPKDFDEIYLFPSKTKDGLPITWKAADNFLRRAVNYAGLSHRGISGHSLRRSFITKLSNNGMDVHHIQRITGHKSLSVVQSYIETNPTKLNQALTNIFS
jgi:integrase/recombinase XerD